MMRWFGLVLAAVLVAGCGRATPPATGVGATPRPTPTVAPTPAPSPTPLFHTIMGTFDLIGTFPGPDCSGTGGYDDIHEGTDVALKDRQGSVIAISTLGPGESQDRVCRFAFTIDDVPELPFYTVEVSHRGGVTKSLADLRADGWRFALQLGGY
jgi:hypothetical protein